MNFPLKANGYPTDDIFLLLYCWFTRDLPNVAQSQQEQFEFQSTKNQTFDFFGTIVEIFKPQTAWMRSIIFVESKVA